MLAKDCDNIVLSAGETNFIAGKSAIFMQDPTVTHLIEVARKTKKANPDAEFTVLGALTKDKDSTEKGFMRNSVATFGAMVSKTSKNAKEIVKFLRWMYRDENNYLLCKYGREGVEWEYDKENGTYEYLVGDYIEPPYSGILSIVENQAVADLQYAGYTDEEKSWIATARQKENYLQNDTVDYLVYDKNYEHTVAKGSAAVALMKTVNPIWSGNKDAANIATNFEAARQKFVRDANAYLLGMYQSYNNLK